MGWEIIHDDGQKQCAMRIGNVAGIIIRNRAGYTGAAAGTNQPAITGLTNHISWGIEPWNTAEVKAELEKRGLDPRPDMNGKFQSFHVHDPDGWDLQISNQTDTSELRPSRTRAAHFREQIRTKTNLSGKRLPGSSLVSAD